MSKKTFTPFVKNEPKNAGKKGKGAGKPIFSAPKKKAGRGK